MFTLTNALSEDSLDELAKHFDHHSAEYRSHAVDILMHMQAKHPMVHTQSHGGFWVATRAEDCLAIAKNAETLSNWPAEVIPPLEPTLMIPINVDPPELYDYRAVLNPAFAPNKVKAYVTYIRELAEQLLDELIARGGGDLARDYAQPLTGMVTLHIAGLPPEDWNEYAPPLHDLLYSTRPMEERLAAMAVMIEKMRSEIRRLQDNPVPGSVLEHLFNASMAGRKLRLDEIDSIILIMLGGGLDTTQALLGMSAVFLGCNPDYRQQLIDQPELMDNAIEELLRFFPPTQGNARRATQDISIAGQEVKADEYVFMSYLAANRDPKDFSNPHEVDFTRGSIRHFSFGVGPHRCVGSHVARIEVKTMLEVLLAKAPDYRLVEEGLELADDIGSVAAFKSVSVLF